MISNETLIVILFFVVNILTACVFGLLDSRNFWRKKYEEVLSNENICSRR